MNEKPSVHPLRFYRKRAHMTQVQLSHRCHVAPPDIVALELGKKLPTRSQAQKIGAALGIKVEALFPDGCSTYVPGYNMCGKQEILYVPPEPPAKPVPRYPSRPFSVRCPKCGATLCQCVDDLHPGPVDWQECYQCGMEFVIEERPSV